MVTVINHILFNSTKDGVYNLACSEQLVLPELLTTVQAELARQLGSDKKL